MDAWTIRLDFYIGVFSVSFMVLLIGVVMVLQRWLGFQAVGMNTRVRTTLQTMKTSAKHEKVGDF